MTAELSNPVQSSSNELERLRDILYGEQTRTTETRLTALENRMSALEKQLSALTTKLSDEKVSRETLGEMLIELGQRLQNA